MKWFKHDTDASIDAKLQELLLDYGATGYGLYWYCVELIAKGVSPNNITFELEHDARIIARNLNLTLEETKNMMQKMVELGLFDINQNKRLACVSLAYKLDDSMRKGRQIEEIVNKFKESGKSRKIPDKSGKSLLEEEEDIELERDVEEERHETDACASDVRNEKHIPDCPQKQIINLYLKNIIVGIYPRIWNGCESASLRSRWREDKGRQDLDWWDRFFKHIAKSDWLMGRINGKDGKPFQISLPWIVKNENFKKIINGNYDNR